MRRDQGNPSGNRILGFCPIMQYHSDGNARPIPSRDRTPWNIQEQTGDPHVIAVFREFANLRMNLIPYIRSQAWQSSQTGLPLMRPLFLEYPGNIAIREAPYEYLFGDALLVAPITDESASSWQVYLPALLQAVDLAIFAKEPSNVTVAGQPFPRLNAEEIRRSVPGWWWDTQKQQIRIHLPESAKPAMITVQ